MAEQYKNYVGGKWRSARSGKEFENRNPANRNDLIGMFPASGAADVDDAVAAAKKAFAAWRLVPAPKRGEILYRVGDLLKRYKEDFARIETREMGKVLKETRGDVQEGIDCAFYNRRRVRADHAVEFSSGDSNMEVISRASMRQYNNLEASRRHTAHRSQAF
jgi:aldehyde dehydrogenase (NAD+)